jgi:hypothetical protein
MPRDVRRTVVQVEVFSDGPYGGDAANLEGVAYAIDQGDCIGQVEIVTADEPVPADEVEAHLLRIGNDGAFFDDETDTCRHCGRTIVSRGGRWIDPDATGDDSVWRETCDANDTFTAQHEPEEG